MPCATVHMALAGRVLRRWEDRPGEAPFPVARPGVRQSFLHGALAPDMGFVPGNHRLISEAAHYVRTGDLTRALLRDARSVEEEAFAWGWASHLLADVEIHPLVGRAVGERLFGDRSRRMDALTDVATHVSLEVGLDVAVLRGEGPGLPPPPARPFFPHHGRIRFLTRALEDTYGVVWDEGLLVRHHLQAVRLTRWWPRMLRLLPLRAPGRSGTEARRAGAAGLSGDEPALAASLLAGPAAGLVRRIGGRGTPLSGFLAPEAPRRWFLQEVLDRFHGFGERFQGWVDAGLAGVGNPNLETGEASAVGTGHPATDLAAEKLTAARTSTAPVPG